MYFKFICSSIIYSFPFFVVTFNEFKPHLGTKTSQKLVLKQNYSASRPNVKL